MIDIIKNIYDLLTEVTDPEIPVLNVVEMGIVRDVQFDDEKLIISITPSYSGCPAMKVIEDDIIATLNKYGYGYVQVITTYSPPWTSDWMTEEAREKLREYGIAPPTRYCGKHAELATLQEQIACPMCNSEDIEIRSEFGSTSCKALYFCNNCSQPFEYFKCI